MDSLKQLVREAHRRSLWQVLGIYLAVSWGVYQVISEATDLLGLPDWVPGFAVVLLLIGLPIVMATAFVQEGSRTAEPVDPTLMPMIELPPAPAPRVAQHFTWQKAVLGGITAFLLLGITAGGYMGLRNAGVGPFGSLVASGELDEREPILIAEFAPLNSDTMLAVAVTEAFRVDFAQSSSITVVEPSHIRGVLQRMTRAASTRVDAELAHEIAVRDNIKAYVTGEVTQAGSKYIVSAKLIATSDRRVLALYKEMADSKEEIIAAVDRLSRKLRGRIGDSFKTIRAERPLEAVSTPSLEALHKYTLALNALDVNSDFDAGISLLHEALELDSAFAMAWRKLAVAYANTGFSRELAVQAATKAFEYRDRLPDAERYKTAAYYYHGVTQDWGKALNAYRLLEERDPDYPPNNLGLIYDQLRDLKSGEAAYRRAMEVDSLLSNSYMNLAYNLMHQGRREEAIRTIDEAERRFGNNATWEWTRITLDASALDYAAAQRRAEQQLDATHGNALHQTVMGVHLVHLNAVRGKLAAADRHIDNVIASELDRGAVSGPLYSEVVRALIALHAQRQPERALQIMDAALQKRPLAALPRLDRPYLLIAQVYAGAGQTERARALLAEYEAEVPRELRGDDRRELGIVKGTLAGSAGQHAEAIAQLRRADVGRCVICVDPALAAAFERAAQPDSAITYYRHYLETHESGRLDMDAVYRGSVLERLADLYAARGDRQNAARYAAQFVELWQNADAELQPRVRAKREMLRQFGEM